MSTSTTTAHMGRQVWLSIRESFDVLSAKIPLRYHQPLNGPSFGRFAYQSPLAPFSRSFHTFRAFTGLPHARISTSHVRRSCTSGGLLLLGLSSPSSPTPSVVATCTAAADSALTTVAAQKASISHLARQTWKRNALDSRIRRGQLLDRRSSSSKSSETSKTGDGPESVNNQPNPEPQKPTEEPSSNPLTHDATSLTNSVSKYLHIPQLPKIPTRPTREELLAAANGFWERLKVRFKWFSIRSMRPWNIDEWGAFLSWFMLGHLVWVLVGTTTFFSLIIFFINTVFAQETLAKWIGDYLTQSAGLTVIFESAIVPKWKDGVITFRNVFVSRRPGQTRSSVTKGSSSNAAAVAAAARRSDQELVPIEEDDGNYTQFDVTVNTVNVTLSFIKWWNGQGLLKDVEVKGVRGVVDRTSVNWSAFHTDPLSYRHEHNPGDFEIEHFKMEDLLVTVHQPGGFRPFSVSIYSCELPQLRKQWLFYDFLSATHMSGSFDSSLFTIHPRQVHGAASGDEERVDAGLGEPTAWKKFSRLRIDGLKIDHLNRGDRGPFGWIYEGNVDIVADVTFPMDPEEGIGKVVSEFYEKMEEAVTSNRYLRMLDSSDERSDTSINTTTVASAGFDADEHLILSAQRPVAAWSESPPIMAATAATTSREASPTAAPSVGEAPAYLIMDLRIHMNDVKAAVPLFSNPHISYVNQALVRPIVAYINAKRTYIPIGCRIVKRASDFDGAWGAWDSGLMDDLGAEVYGAFARDVEDQQSRVRRLKRVGLWTLSLAVHALLAGVAGDLI